MLSSGRVKGRYNNDCHTGYAYQYSCIYLYYNASKCRYIELVFPSEECAKECVNELSSVRESLKVCHLLRKHGMYKQNQ